MRIFKSKIYRRFLVTLLALSLPPMIILSWAALRKGASVIHRQSLLQLEISADAAEAMVYKYLDYLKRQTSALCSDRYILRAVSNHSRRLDDVKIIESLNRHLASNKLPAFHECVETLILNLQGRVIASSDASHTGKDLSQTDYFMSGQKSAYVSDVFRDKDTGEIGWVVSAPLMDKISGKLLGVLANRIDPNTLSDITTGRNAAAFGAKTNPVRKGETGETYIVNRNKFMITESRFYGDVILKQSVDTEIVRRSLAEGELKMGAYSDYRGVPVFGASMVIKGTGWIIVSEMDFAEAHAPVRKARAAILIGGCILIIGIFVVAWRFALRMTRPITRIVQADKVSMQGDLKHAFIPDNEIPGDELGDVMRSRNIMLGGIIEYEKEIRESEERYRRLFNGSSDAVFVLPVSPSGKLGNFIDVNEAACKRLGYSREELLGMSPEDIDAPEMAEQRAEAVKQYCVNSQVTFEMVQVTKDGRRVPVEINATYFEFRGQPLAIGVARDITERKKSEAMILQERDRAQQYFDIAGVMLVVIANDQTVKRINKKGCEILGCTEGDIVGKNWFDTFIPERIRDELKDAFARLLAGEIKQFESHENPVQTRSGDERIIAWHNTILKGDGHIIATLSSGEDITERKQVEEKIKALAEYPLQNPLPILRISRDGVLVFANPASDSIIRSWNCKQGELAPDFLRHVVVDNPTGETFEIQHGDKIFSFVIVPVKDAGYINLYGMDITLLKQQERVLLENEEILLKQKEELNTIIDSSPILIFYKDVENRFIRVNKAMAESTGLTKEELEGKSCFDIFPPSQAEKFWKDDKEVLASGYPKLNIIEPFETKKGTRWGQTDKIPYRDKRGNIIGIIGFVIDITERRKAERSSAILYAVTKVLAESATLEEAPPRILQAISESIECEMSTLWLADPRTNALYCASTWYLPSVKPHKHEESSMKLANSVASGVYPAGFSDVLVDDNFMSASVTVDNEPHQAFCFPAVSMEKMLGVMVFIGRMRTFADKSVVDVMVAIGKQLGLFIKHREAEEQTRLQLRRVSALHDIDVAIAGSFDLKVSLNIFLEKVVTLLHADAADVLLFNPHTQTLEYVAGRGFRTNAIQRTFLRFGEGLAGRAALEGRLFSVANLSKEKDIFSLSGLLSDEQFICYFGIPLTAKGQVKGVLEVFHRSPLDPGRDWLDFLEVLAGQCAIAVDNAGMYGDLQRSHIELVMAYDSTLEGWSMALDLRDKETEGHTKRVTEMTLNLARAMGIEGGELAHIRRGALLHDIGKMGIPDNVLLKPGPLTDEEWIIMRMHPTFAHQMISHVAYLKQAIDIPYCHHEKWDGTGYPRGLKGEQIPLSARIFAVVDVWDALRSDRPYRKGWPEEKVRDHIRSLSGTHFDPKVVESFLRAIQKQ